MQGGAYKQHTVRMSCPAGHNNRVKARGKTNLEVPMGIEVGGVLGLLILIADVWAIIKTVQSSATTGVKVIWTVVILLLPVLGLLIWLLAGPRSAR